MLLKGSNTTTRALKNGLLKKWWSRGAMIPVRKGLKSHGEPVSGPIVLIVKEVGLGFSQILPPTFFIGYTSFCSIPALAAKTCAIPPKNAVILAGSHPANSAISTLTFTEN